MPSCSVFIVCEAPEARGRPAGCSSAWFQASTSPAWSFAYPSVQNVFRYPWSSFALAGPRPDTAGPLISSALEYTCSNQFDHSFIQQIYIGYLLCARTVLELGHTAVNKTVKTPVLMELVFKWKEVSSQQQVGKIQLSMLDGECSSHWRQEGGWGSCSFKQGKRKALLRRG